MSRLYFLCVLPLGECALCCTLVLIIFLVGLRRGNCGSGRKEKQHNSVEILILEMKTSCVDVKKEID